MASSKTLLLAALLALGPMISEVFADQRKTVYMAVWRGCEEACKSFIKYFSDNDKKIDFIIRDADRDKEKLELFVAEIRAGKPDLVVTWGTSVSKRILGPWRQPDPDKYITDIPAVFMIVADPVGAKISKNAQNSGRPNVTGTLNRASAKTQIQTIQQYRPIKTIGMVYNDNELNSRLSVEGMKEAAKSQNITLVEERIQNDKFGKPRVEDIQAAVLRIAKKRPDFLYLGSSSFLTKFRTEFSQAAFQAGLPVAAGSEVPVRKAGALLGVAAKYSSIGRLAALQAEEILFRGKKAGNLTIKELKRYSVLINIDSARRLGLYPPLSLLKISEIVGQSLP